MWKIITEAGDSIHGRYFLHLEDAKEAMLRKYGTSGTWEPATGMCNGEFGWDYMSGKTLIGTVYFSGAKK